jgi:hypothetical protein
MEPTEEPASTEDVDRPLNPPIVEEDSSKNEEKVKIQEVQCEAHIKSPRESLSQVQGVDVPSEALNETQVESPIEPSVEDVSPNELHAEASDVVTITEVQSKEPKEGEQKVQFEESFIEFRNTYF